MEQTRKKFLRQLIVGGTAVPFLIQACKKEDGNDPGNDTSSGDCTVTDTETDGPYPLYNSRGLRS